MRQSWYFDGMGWDMPLPPGVQAFWTALVTDICKSYDDDGILLFNRRNRPLLNSLGTVTRTVGHSEIVTVPFKLQPRAQNKLWTMQKQGYLKLNKFNTGLSRGNVNDRYYVEVAQLLLEYAEGVAWDRLFVLWTHQSSQAGICNC